MGVSGDFVNEVVGYRNLLAHSDSNRRSLPLLDDERYTHRFLHQSNLQVHPCAWIFRPPISDRPSDAPNSSI
jgi:hypothetical protein